MSNTIKDACDMLSSFDRDSARINVDRVFENARTPIPQRVVVPIEGDVGTPVLHEDAKYGVLGEILRKFEAYTEGDLAAILIQLLVVIGNMLGRTAHFLVEATKHYAVVFALVVGDSAKSRKGTSWNFVREVASRVDPRWLKCIRSGVSSGEGIISALADKEAFDPAYAATMLLEMTEFSELIRVTKRDGNTVSPLLRNLWDSRSAEILTRNDPIRAQDGHVSVIGHITKVELIRTYNVVEMGNGFGNRFLHVFAQRSKLLPEAPEFDFQHLEQEIKHIRDAIARSRHLGLVRRDEEAKILWASIYEELSQSSAHDVDVLTARAEAYTMRVALIFACLDMSDVIRVCHLKAALAVWAYSEASCRYIFGGCAQSLAEACFKLLKDAGSAGMTRTEIRDGFQRHKTKKELDDALAYLEQRGRARAVEEPSGGAPVHRWFPVLSH